MRGSRNRGRPCTKSLDGVKNVCVALPLELWVAKLKLMAREKWREFVNSISGGVIV